MVGGTVIRWLIVALIAVCVFFLAQWIIPMIFGLVGVNIPGHIVNILALLIAVGVFYWGCFVRPLIP